jgi:hypothetical protein
MNNKDQAFAKSLNELLSIFMRQAAVEAASCVRKQGSVRDARPLRKAKKGQKRVRT